MRLARVDSGNQACMLWLILIIAVIAIVGLGSLLKAALVTLLVIAAVVVIAGLAIGRVLGR